MNCVFFTGNVGKDAETRSTQSGDVLSFSVAVRQGVSRDAKDEWYRCSLWGARGTSLKQHITKGAKVAVCGTLSIGEYDGKPQFNVNVTEIDPFCGGKRDGASGGSDARSAGQASGGWNDADLDDSTPF